MDSKQYKVHSGGIGETRGSHVCRHQRAHEQRRVQQGLIKKPHPQHSCDCPSPSYCHSRWLQQFQGIMTQTSRFLLKKIDLP